MEADLSLTVIANLYIHHSSTNSTAEKLLNAVRVLVFVHMIKHLQIIEHYLWRRLNP